jgi:hypothetical protein
MEDDKFREIVLYEIRELRKDIKKLEQWKSKVYGGVTVLVIIFEVVKHKFIK